MNREEIALKYIDKKGKGIEIGPSHNPLAPKKQGYSVQIIDHATQAQLIEKYKSHNIDLHKIEKVDFVWSGESYSNLTGRKKHYDWIIASHLVEHTPDLIGFLKNCDDILKDDGVLFLAIPDKRYCFDLHRPITSLSKVIDSHLSQNKIHSVGSVAEYFLNAVSKNGEIAWDNRTNGDLRLVHTLEEAKQGMKSVTNDRAYLDIHNWCFVPHSFRLLIHDLNSLGFISFREAEFFPTNGSEFYVLLSNKGKGIDLDRLKLLEKIEKELKNDSAKSNKNLLHRMRRNLRVSKRIRSVLGVVDAA